MSFGGVPRRAFTARGGEVLVAESEDDMQNILLRANGALVVVDYWARYVKGDSNGFCM
jgi:D-aminopeptidase